MKKRRGQASTKICIKETQEIQLNYFMPLVSFKHPSENQRIADVLGGRGYKEKPVVYFHQH